MNEELIGLRKELEKPSPSQASKIG